MKTELASAAYNGKLDDVKRLLKQWKLDSSDGPKYDDGPAEGILEGAPATSSTRPQGIPVRTDPGEDIYEEAGDEAEARCEAEEARCEEAQR